MIHLVQRLLPDELLTSGLVRTSRHAQLPISVVAEFLTGRVKWRPSFFQIGQVRTLAKAFDMTPTELLSRHTVFTYATAFMEPDVFAGSLANALSTGTAARAMGSTIQSVSDHVPWRQFCFQCVHEDLRRWGESYWHRKHNLPGVVICTAHGCVLRRTEMPTSGRNSWSYLLPHEVEVSRSIASRPSHFDINLAKSAVALLNRGLDAPSGQWSSKYRESLFRKGLVTPSRFVHAVKLQEWGRRQIGQSYKKYGLKESEATFSWMPLMVRPSEAIPFIPLKHTIFQTALELQPRVCIPKLDYISTGNFSRITAAVDSAYATALRQVIEIYLNTGDSLRVCDALALVGCWHSYRHNRRAFPALSDAVLELRQSGASVRRIEHLGMRPQ